jgi:hypothetical protein
VHLGAGRFDIDRTIVLPAERAVRLMGDGFMNGTQLRWTGAGAGPVLRLAGPSAASVAELEIAGSNRAVGLAIDRVDQPGARVVMEEAAAEEHDGTGLLADHVGSCFIDLRDFYDSGAQVVAERVVGPGHVQIIGGGASNNELSYDVEGGGQLLSADRWYETHVQPGFLRVRGPSHFMLQGARVALPPSDSRSVIEMDRLGGTVTLAATEVLPLNQRAPRLVATNSAGGKLLVVASLLRRDPLQGDGADIKPRAICSRRIASPQQTIHEDEASDAATIAQALAPLRWRQPEAQPPAGATRPFIQRVRATGATVGFQLTGR